MAAGDTGGLAQELAAGWKNDAAQQEARDQTDARARPGAAAPRKRKPGVGFRRAGGGQRGGEGEEHAGHDSSSDSDEASAGASGGGAPDTGGRGGAGRGGAGPGPGRGEWRCGEGGGGWGWVALGMGGGVLLEDGHRLMGSKFDPHPRAAGRYQSTPATYQIMRGGGSESRVPFEISLWRRSVFPPRNVPIFF